MSKKPKFNIKEVPCFNEILKSPCLLGDGRIAVISPGNKVKVFDPNNNFNCDIIINNPSVGYISTLGKMKKDKLLVGTQHGIIFIWNVNPSEDYEYIIKDTTKNVTWKVSHVKKEGLKPFCLENKVEIHDRNEIISIAELTNDRMASSSRDQPIKIWKSSSPSEVIAKFGCEAHLLTQLKDKEVLLAKGKYSDSIFFYDLTKYELLSEVTDIYSDIIINVDSNTLLIYYYKSFIPIDTNTFIKKDDINVVELKTIVLLNYKYIVCITYPTGEFAIFDLNTKELIKTKASHSGQIDNLFVINEKYFMSLPYEGIPKLWEIQ